MTGKDLKDFINGKVPHTYVLGFMPDEPANCAAVMPTPGGSPDEDIPDLDERTFQVLVRGSDYPSGENIIQQIFDALKNVLHVDIGTRHVNYIRAIQTPFWIGEDQNGRSLFSVNFRMGTKPKV